MTSLYSFGVFSYLYNTSSLISNMPTVASYVLLFLTPVATWNLIPRGAGVPKKVKARRPEPERLRFPLSLSRTSPCSISPTRLPSPATVCFLHLIQSKVQGASAIRLPASTPTAPVSLDDLAQVAMRDNSRQFVSNDSLYSNTNRFRDEKLAKENPKAYCADRCLATGHCEVLEDIYEMATSQVQKFCEACAGDDECSLSYA